MTYLSFLLLFLGLPLAALLLALLAARRAPQARLTRVAWAAVGAHILLALVYTTPWDNYLVATGVWTYARARVLGVTLGWVPLEEYGFFVLQTLLTGLCAALLASRWPARVARRALLPGWLKLAAVLGLGGLWAAAVWALSSGWKPGTYLGLELVWALPPITLQVAVGAQVLWARRHAVLAGLLPMTLYLCAADALAIRAGVWHIAEAQSLGLFLVGLPIEEGVFFLLTNMLVVFGVTLVVAPPVWMPQSLFRWRGWQHPAKPNRAVAGDLMPRRMSGDGQAGAASDSATLLTTQ